MNSFYKVNNEVHYSQFTAWVSASKQKTVPTWHFFDEKFSACDWTKEPIESWDTLCKERCLELRNQYKTLSLFYSAGRDSHHILECFDRFNIKLDYIILIKHCFVPLRLYEYENYILPQAKKYVEKHPHTKIKNIELDFQLYLKYYSDDFLERPYKNINNKSFWPMNPGFYIKEIASSDAEGFIIGLDKPRIILENNKFYSVFLDKILGYFETENNNLEYFYYSPNNPKIHIKQTWMVLHHLLTHHKDKLSGKFVTEFFGNFSSSHYDELCLSCGRGQAFDLSASSQNGASKIFDATTLSKNVYDILTKNNLSKIVDNFNYSLQYLDSVKEKWNVDDQLSFSGVYSKKYFLRNFI